MGHRSRLESQMTSNEHAIPSLNMYFHSLSICYEDLVSVSLGWQDGSAGEGACHRGWGTGFDPQNPHSGRRKLTQQIL